MQAHQMMSAAVSFKNTSAGYYKGMADLKGALTGIFKEALTVPGLVFQINTLGGAIANGPEGAYPHRAYPHRAYPHRAYPHRAYPYLGEAQAYWENADRAADLQAAIGRIRDHIAQAGIDRHYANYPDIAFHDWPAAYYGRKNYERLQSLKQRFDPENHVRHPQSVRVPV